MAVTPGRAGALLLSLLLAAATASAQRPDKFIPTYIIVYGNANGARPAEETARFDLFITNFSVKNSRLWGSGGMNSWRSLKALNPNMKIVVYAMGPGEYNTASWGQLAEGWEWLKQNHGNDAADRWTTRGARFGTYLENSEYRNERLMIVGNRAWQEYWTRAVYADYWGGGKGIDLDGVDGLFSDNTQYTVPFYGKWRREGSDDRDDPEEYWDGAAHLHERWREHMNGFLERAIPWFAEMNMLFTLNFGNMGARPEWWQELDALPHPPFAAMDEAGFISPYGSGATRFKTWDWEKKVRAMRSLRNVRALINAHATVPEGDGLEKMDVPDPTGMTGWDALWFAIGSFLMGYDDAARNAYMNFTLWSYTGYFWFDEFDPQYLHLGKALGDYYRSGNIYLREFEDGYVAVNPGTGDARGMAAPAAAVRVLDHSNFRNAEDAARVSQFDLPAHRAAILLKEGRRIGNEDNGGGE